MAEVTFHDLRPGTTALACDLCGCLVPKEERARAAHSEWHREREEIVLDLTVVRERIAS